MKLFHKLPLIFILNFLFPFDGDTHDFFLPNGMKVIFMEKDVKEEVSIGVYYNIGSKYEQIGERGLNRILAGSYDNLRKEKYNKEYIDTQRAKAYFKKDLTGFVNEIEKINLYDALKVEANLMRNFVSEIKENSIENSKNKIKQKIKDHNQSFEANIAKAYRDIMPKNYPYYHDVWGIEEEFDTLSFELYQDFFKRHYSPNNAILILVGDFDIKSTTKQVFENFANINSSNYFAPELDYSFNHTSDITTTKILAGDLTGDDPIQLQVIISGFKLPSIRDENISVIEHLGNILKYDVLSEKKYFDLLTNKQKNSLISYNTVNNRVGSSHFVIMGLNLGENSSKPKKFKKSIIKTFKYIEENGIDEDLLIKYKKQQLKEFYINSFKSYNDLNWNLAFSELILGDYKYYNRDYEIIKNLNNDGIKNAVKKMIIEDNLYVYNWIVGENNILTSILKPFIYIIRRTMPVGLMVNE